MEIRKVHTDTNFTIIEWEEDGTKQRAKLPFITSKPITEKMLSLALPYSIVWSDAVMQYIASKETIAEEIDKNLYNAKIFTLADLRRANPNVVLGLIQKSFGIDYNKFMKMIENYLEA